MAYQVELTDTFGGEANYSWMRRAIIKTPPHPVGHYNPRKVQAAVMRRAKAAVGMSGVRGRVTDYGDGYEFRPYGLLQVMFVTWDDWSDEANKVDGRA